MSAVRVLVRECVCVCVCACSEVINTTRTDQRSHELLWSALLTVTVNGAGHPLVIIQTGQIGLLASHSVTQITGLGFYLS